MGAGRLSEQSPPPADDLGDTVLLLRPVADPLARRGLPPRPAVRRLRRALRSLLREHGFRAVILRDPTPAELLGAADWL